MLKKRLINGLLLLSILISCVYITPCTIHASNIDNEIFNSYEENAYLVDDDNEMPDSHTYDEDTYDEPTEDFYDPEDPMNDKAAGIIQKEFYDEEAFAISEIVNSFNGISHSGKFDSCVKRKGIDVSKHNGAIDWNKVRASGIEYAFIRVGYSTIMSGELGTDPRGIENLKNAKAAGLKVGVYFFSTAITTNEAVAEAQYTLNLIKGIDIDLPIVMDYEFAWSGETPGRLYTANLSKDAATANVLAFCKKIEAAHYQPMLYANKSFLRDNLNASVIDQDYPIWLANYTNKTNYDRPYSFWQFSETGSVDGIGGSVDLNIWYDGGFTGLVQKPDGKFYYYYKGAVNTNFVGFVQHTDGKWYYVNYGKVDYTANGLYQQVGGTWYYCRGGVIDWNFTGLAPKTNGKWYAVKNGKYDSSFSGLAPKYNGGFGYAKNGAVQDSFVGFVQYKDGRWYYVDHGVINYSMTGLCPQIGGGWYYAKGGVIDWQYTGLAKNTYGDWYAVKNGIYDNSFTGLMEYNGGFYYVRRGTLIWSYTGFVQYKDGAWYYVQNGSVNYYANGLRYDQYGQAYYVRGGRVDWNYSGKASCEDGKTYMVKKGKKI